MNQVIPESADPIFADCFRSFPERPAIDHRATLLTREELDTRIDYWMRQIKRAVK